MVDKKGIVAIQPLKVAQIQCKILSSSENIFNMLLKINMVADTHSHFNYRKNRGNILMCPK